MPFNTREQRREETERLRGYIVYLLSKARPKPMDMDLLMRLLDKRNLPVSRRRLSEEIDYLRSLRLLRIFPASAESDLDDVAQAKLIQRYADTDDIEEFGDSLCARISTAGINFQDGVNDIPGVCRVE